MGKQENTLSRREKIFCQNYVRTGNVREAAARSGYPVFPEKHGTGLLGEQRIRQEIARIQEGDRQSDLLARTITGYERLAFGGIADAVRLLLFGDSVQAGELETMDLFNVSEIKRNRDGGLEIKFYDRLKALERLQQTPDENGESATGFLAALEQGAMAMERADDHAI